MVPKLHKGPWDKEVERALKLGTAGKFKEEFDLLRSLAEKKNAAAIMLLALCYERGIGVKENYSEAIAWLQKGTDWHLGDITWALATC